MQLAVVAAFSAAPRPDISKFLRAERSLFPERSLNDVRSGWVSKAKSLGLSAVHSFTGTSTESFPGPPDGAIRVKEREPPSGRDILKQEMKGREDTHKDCSTDPMKPVMLPEFVGCPAQCPYTVALTAKACSKVCVSEGRCSDFDPVLHFGDPVSLECVPTCGKDLDQRIPGCALCSSPGICEKCASGWGFMPSYELSPDGRFCRNVFHHFIVEMYIVIGVVLVILLYYLALLFLRPLFAPEQDVYKKALAHRQHYKAVHPETGELYSLWGTSMLSDDIAGQGVMQYFTWNAWMMVVASALALGAYMSYQDTKFLDNVEASMDQLACYAPRMEDLLEVSNVSRSAALNMTHAFVRASPTPANVSHALMTTIASQAPHALVAAGIDPKDPLAKYFDIDLRMFKFLVPTYLAVVLLSLILSWWQCWYTHKFESNHTGLRHFAVMVNGLDHKDTTPKHVFEHIIEHSTLPRDEFVGVSIAYDIYECADDLEVMVDNWGKEEPVAKDDVAWYKLPWLDSFFVDVGPREHEDPAAMVKHLSSSGSAIVIMRTSHSRDALVAKKKVPPLSGDLKDEHLTIDPVHDEPPAVIWKSFSRRNLWLETLKGVVLFTAVIGGWIMLYLPYAMDYIFYASVPGQAPSFTEDFLLGLLISLGNAIVGNAVEIVVGWCGIRDQGRRDMFVLYLGFAATFFNTVLDLLLVMEVAKGTSLDEAFEGHRVGYDAALAEGIVAIIIPGYLIIPYIAAPIFLFVLPYWVSRWIVRSRSVGIREAERAVEAPPFDVVPWRYSDFVNNLTVCLTMLLFTTPASSTVMTTLVISFALIFCIDKYLLLRGTSVMMYTSNKLAKNFSRLFAFPTACLAGITAWWGVKAGVLPTWAPYAAAALHIPVYLMLLEFLRPVERMLRYERVAKMVGQEQLKDEEEEPDAEAHQGVFGRLRSATTLHVRGPSTDKTYFDVQEQLHREGKHYTYWNTNPALCLRHRYLGEFVPGADQRLAPFSHGKVQVDTPGR
jgi:hypothetical protein